jgi:putative ABC transport system permease protein
VDTLIQDLRQALRMLRDQPAFTATAVLALALGIGVNTAIFSVVDAVLLRPLPYPEPERLVAPLQNDNGVPLAILATPAHVTHLRAQSDLFEDVVAWRTQSFDYTAGDMPANVTAGAVSDGYFRTLGATFIAGRAPATDEHVPGAANVVVISESFWTRRLGGKPDAVGSTLPLNGVAHTIIGITSSRFDVRGIDVRGFGVPEIWVPLKVDPDLTDFSVTLDVFARLRDGVSLAAAQDRLAASIDTYRERYPADKQNWQFTALDLQETIVRGARPMLLTLTGAVALVLLVACANVANLLLVRAAGRSREVAIRATLGAGRARLVRQLLTESLVLTTAGGALGLLAGIVGVRSLLASGLMELPRLGATTTALLGLDWRVATFTVGLSIATGIAFGLVPALVGARADLSTVMKDATSRAAGGRRQTKAQAVFVTVEVALAVVLVCGAGLLIRTSIAIGAVDLGVDVDNVLTLRTGATDAAEATSTAVAANERALARLRTIPGVEAAASSLGMLLAEGLFAPFDIVGRQNAGPATGGAVAVPSSADYFATAGIALLRGRRFTADDDRGAPAVVVINEAMARQYWQDGSDPLNDRIRVGGTVIPEAADEPERQIIGIVGDVRHKGIVVAEPEPAMYFPHAQLSEKLGRVAVLPTGWLVRTSVPPRPLAATVQQALREETGRTVTDIELLADAWLESISAQRLNLWLMTLFGGAALLLGAVGIYGLVAYTVQHRRHEIGIRMAVGARPGAVRNMVIRDGMLRVAAGVALGLVAAYFSANLLASLLFGVEARDPVVFVTVPVVLAAVGLVAVCVPALRATRVDPTAALRSS